MSRAQLTSTVEQNTGGAVAPFVAGKNKIINGDFGIWARGTSFTNPSDQSYTADRFLVNYNGTGATRTISQQTFDYSASPAADKLPITGYPSTYFLRYAVSVAGSGNTYNFINQRIEDVRTLAGQTVTVSFWGKADSSRSINGPVWRQNFGSGGSGDVDTSSGSTFSFTTSWQRFTTTFAVPPIAGKTIGTSSYVNLFIASLPSNTTFTVDIWGVQVEAGSVATPFTTATGTLSGELAACMRYFQTYRGDSTYTFPGLTMVFCNTTTRAFGPIALPTPLRSVPTISVSNLRIGYDSITITGAGIDQISNNNGSYTAINLYFDVASGLTAGAARFVQGANSSSAKIDLASEL